MTNSRFYHNPHCSKSKQALTLLEEAGVTVDIILYKESGLRISELAELLSLLRSEDIQAIVRKKEALELDFQGFGDETEIIPFLNQHPEALERPIFVHNQSAIIGRPPEKVLTLL